MILEYQKEQQNKPAYKVGTDEFKYFPSDINEPLNPDNLINLPSGAPAAEGEIVKKVLK